MKRLRVFSGCTEYGSEVQAFIDRGHIVETCGISGDVTYLQDIRTFHPAKKHYDFMSFHPDCSQFSKANWRLGKCKDRNPDLSVVEACFRIVNEAKPTYWMIENPTGCLRHYIGRPQYSIKYGDFGHYCQKPTDLWGVLPFFQSYQINKVPLGHHGVTAYTNGTRRPDQRAIVPYGLSLVICLAVERETYNEGQKKIQIPTPEQSGWK